MLSLLMKYFNKESEKSNYDRLVSILNYNNWSKNLEELTNLKLENNGKTFYFYYHNNISFITGNIYSQKIPCNICRITDQHFSYAPILIEIENHYIFLSKNEYNSELAILDYLITGEGKKLVENSPNFPKLLAYSYKYKKMISQNKDLEEILNSYYNVEKKPFGIEVFTRIQPSKVIFGNPANIYNIPQEKRFCINKISIHTDIDNNITAVKLEDAGQHPNCKEGWYCLGTYHGKLLTLKCLSALISSIKIINLNDSYYTPKYLSDIICNRR